MKTRMLVALSVGLALSMAAWAQGKEPYVGTWKLNVAKSKYEPGPMPRSAVDVNTVAADGAMRSVQEWVEADGKAARVEWSAKFDGKDYPVMGGAPGTTISLKRPNPKDPGTVDWVWKVPGQFTATGRTVYSKDGKTRVIDDKLVETSGKTTVRHRFYDRQ
jgi:hypothetical protein